MYELGVLILFENRMTGFTSESGIRNNAAAHYETESVTAGGRNPRAMSPSVRWPWFHMFCSETKLTTHLKDSNIILCQI